MTPAAGSRPPKSRLDAKLMAERSIKAGYMKDALKYLKIAHESDPLDFAVMLQLGFAYNMLHDDEEAIRWFQLAAKVPMRKLRPMPHAPSTICAPRLARVRTTAWIFPFYSSRWHDMFSYGQIKTEFKLGNLPFRPLSFDALRGRHPANHRRRTAAVSFRKFVHRGRRRRYALLAWRHGLGGSGRSHQLSGQHAGVGAMIPDYRGGVAFARGWGHHIRSENPGLFFETNADGVFVSRFGNDFLTYSQNRAGSLRPPLDSLGGLRMQFYMNGNFTIDDKRQAWANFAEAGPGIRFRWPFMPPSLMFSVNVMRGAYTLPQYGVRKPNFFDVRAGFWYAFTH